MNRACSFVFLLSFLMAMIGCTAPDALAERLELPALRKLRREAAHRKRRIIFNNDGDDVIYVAKVPTPDALLAVRTSPLIGSQVDSIFYSNSLCFGHALHNSRVMEPFTCREAMFKNNILPGLMGKGIDPIQVMAEFGHKNKIEVFWDMRMNDTHDSMHGGYGPYLRPKFKLDHPDYLVGAENRAPKYGPWSSVDYARPEVRQLLYRFFEEVCQEFDIDGIEMDFFRHACFFKSVAQGGHAGEEELEMMTALIRRVREMTEREGIRRGRPILLATRVPDSIEYCKGIGLDPEKWLAEGLVDILIGTGYFRLNRWQYLIDLGHRYGVPVYPCLSDSRVRTDTRFRRSSNESYRARAMRAWDAGADGIYLFNYFNPSGAIWRELGDPDALRSMDKLYFVTVRDGTPGRYLAKGNELRRLPVLAPYNPFPIPADKTAEIELMVGDDLAKVPQAGNRPEVTCHAQTLGVANIEITLNGKPLGKAKRVDDWQDFAVPPAWVKRGPNCFGFRTLPGKERSGPEPEWSVVYSADRLPAWPWKRMGFRKNCVAAIKDGALFLADRGTESANYAFFRLPCFIRPSDETIVEVRVKPVSGWSSVLIENGVSVEEIQFFTDRIKARYCGLSYSMKTADAFHTYRVVIKDKDFKVFVDGVLRIGGSGRLTSPAYNGRSGVMFGAANSPSLGEAYWKTVKVHSGTASLLDLALSIRFNKKGR